MNRRESVLALIALGAAPITSFAQRAGRTYRIGWLSTTQRSEPYNIAFTKRLSELGFVEGRNLVIEFGFAQGRADKLPELAANLANLNCDLYFCGNEFGLGALRQATRERPIVMVAADYDLVAAGHVDSLARPGGRITGVSMLQTELPAKRLQMLNELLPKVRRVGVLADVASAGQLKVTQAAAAQMRITLVVHEFAQQPYDYPAAFATFARGKAEALLALGSGFFVTARKSIPELAIQHHLPSVFHNAVWVESGGLLSYGPNFSTSYRHAADLVAKVLNGANPGELPIEQPKAVEMVLNMQTARALKVSDSISDPIARRPCDRMNPWIGKVCLVVNSNVSTSVAL